MTPTTPTEVASRTPGRASMEGLTQVAIMLAIGGAAGAASFTHVHDVAATHGQPGWLAWADAVVLELMSVASGLEMRRRKRSHAPVVFPAAVLVVAMTLSLSAQVVDAEASAIGWIAAAIPALGFLIMVKIALAQGGSSQTAVDATPNDRVVPTAPGPAQDATVIPSLGHPSGEPRGEMPQSPARPASVSSLPAVTDVRELLGAARAAADTLDRQGRRVSRQALAEAMRGQGHAVSNARVSVLLRELKSEARDGDGTPAPVRFRPKPRGVGVPNDRVAESPLGIRAQG